MRSNREAINLVGEKMDGDKILSLKNYTIVHSNHPYIQSLFHRIHSFRSIAIINSVRDIDKTFIINLLLNSYPNSTQIGITSIGREKNPSMRPSSKENNREHQKSINKITDVLQIPKNTIIATAKRCILSSDITLEIMKSTDVYTSLGFIILAKSKSQGSIEIAGPSKIKELILIRKYLFELGAKTVLIEGASNRLALTAPEISDATILISGKNPSLSFLDVVKNTVELYHKFQLPVESDPVCQNFIKKIFLSSKIGFIEWNGNRYKYRLIESSTLIGEEHNVIDKISGSTRYLVLSGALTLRFTLLILTSKLQTSKLIIIIKDPSKILIDSKLISKLHEKNIEVKVFAKSPLIALFLAPTFTNQGELDNIQLLEVLKPKIDLPIIYIKGGGI